MYLFVDHTTNRIREAVAKKAEADAKKAEADAEMADNEAKLSLMALDNSTKTSSHYNRTGSRSPESLSVFVHRPTSATPPRCSSATDRLSNELGNSPSQSLYQPNPKVMDSRTYTGRIQTMPLPDKWRVCCGAELIILTFEGNVVKSVSAYNARLVRNMWMCMLDGVDKMLISRD